jgi:hypothetical protein
LDRNALKFRDEELLKGYQRILGVKREWKD